MTVIYRFCPDCARSTTGHCPVHNQWTVVYNIYPGSDSTYQIIKESTVTTNHVVIGKGYTEQLLQLFNGATWDGDLLAKAYRDELVKAGLAERAKAGFNIITKKGVEYLVDLGLVRS